MIKPVLAQLSSVYSQPVATVLSLTPTFITSYGAGAVISPHRRQGGIRTAGVV
ncbi:hypothetical protein KCP74_14970 [Salmonella enterica subsp. enterica]|nr:hypothetical protein KCP74_14970 [Salmonella enterica subsp. enterica]